MLADGGAPEPQKLGLPDHVHMASAQRFALISFIGGQLPVWRDRPDRPSETAETVLTSHLSRHLNGVARNSSVWNFVQFSVEDRDKVKHARNIDLVAAPSGVTIVIGGQGYSDFDVILPIECKRLPTPLGKDRDPREYLFSNKSSAGGVQRFKAGDHGSGDSLAAMIGYVQSQSAADWLAQVNFWVTELSANGEAGWSDRDALSLDNHDATTRLALLSSRHYRVGKLEDINLQHLWIEM